MTLKYPSSCNILSKFQAPDPVFLPILSRFSLDTLHDIFTCIFNHPEDWERLQNQKYSYLISPFHPIGRRKWVWAILSSSEESSQSCVPTHILSSELKCRPRWAFCNWDFLKKFQFTKTSLISMTFGLGKVLFLLLNTPFKNKNHGGITWWCFFTATHKFVSLYE